MGMTGLCKRNLKVFSQEPYIFFYFLILFQTHALKSAWVQSFKDRDAWIIISIKNKKGFGLV